MNELLARVDPSELWGLALVVLPRLLAGLLILAGFWLLQRFTSPAMRATLRRAGLDEALVRILVDNLYRPVILVFGLVMAISQLGVDITAALAGISVVGIAVGFAAQDSIANMIAGLVIFWDKPFGVGDFLTIADQYGRVDEITMRSTRIRTQDNTYVVIPNKNIIDSVVVNHTKHGAVRLNVPVGIAYKENIPEARRVLLAAVTGLEDVSADPAPEVVVAELGGSSVNLLVRVWVSRADQERPVFFRTLESCKLALDAAGIQIPFPHLQLFVDDVQQHLFDRAAAGGLLPEGRSRQERPSS